MVVKMTIIRGSAVDSIQRESQRTSRSKGRPASRLRRRWPCRSIGSSSLLLIIAGEFLISCSAGFTFINPRRACAARVTVVVLSVRANSRTTGYEAANEWHQRVVNNEEMDINVPIFLKRLHSRDMEKTSEKANVQSIAHVPSPAGYIARTHHVNYSPEHALRHVGCIYIRSTGFCQF